MASSQPHAELQAEVVALTDERDKFRSYLRMSNNHVRRLKATITAQSLELSTLRRPDYTEEFVCAVTPADAEDHEHDLAIPCEWTFRCSICHSDVYAEPCPDHAPGEVPGLRMAECTATPRHVTYGHLRDDYGLPCPWCQLNAAAERERAYRQCRHWAWRRWSLTRCAMRWAYSLGVISGYSTGTIDGCNWCIRHVSFRGRRPYVLGVAATTWRCWRRGHRRGDPIIFGYCGRCIPWNCCGSTAYAHAEGCAEGAAA